MSLHASSLGAPCRHAHAAPALNAANHRYRSLTRLSPSSRYNPHVDILMSGTGRAARTFVGPLRLIMTGTIDTIERKLRLLPQQTATITRFVPGRINGHEISSYCAEPVPPHPTSLRQRVCSGRRHPPCRRPGVWWTSQRRVLIAGSVKTGCPLTRAPQHHKAWKMGTTCPTVTTDRNRSKSMG